MGYSNNSRSPRKVDGPKAQTFNPNSLPSGRDKEAGNCTRVRIWAISMTRVTRLNLISPPSHSRRNLPPTTSIHRSSEPEEPPA
ncbi:unnamed protein product [Brassica rapa subsp. narinosa]